MRTSSSIRVRIQLNDDDWRTFIDRHMKSSHEWRSYYSTLHWWCLVILAAAFGPPLLSNQSLTMYHIGFGVLPVAYLVVTHYRQRRKYLVQYGTNQRPEVRKSEVRLSSNALIWKFYGGTAYKYWQHVTGIEREGDAAFIAFDDGNVLMVPAHSFQTHDEFKQFINIVERRITNICPICDYDLTANRLTGCPECGWRRDESQAQTDAAPDKRTGG